MHKRMMKKRNTEIIRCIKNSEILSGNRARYILSSINRNPSIVECLGEWDNEFIPLKNIKTKNRYRFFVFFVDDENIIELFSNKGDWFNGCSRYSKMFASYYICGESKFLQAWYASHPDAYHKVYEAFLNNGPKRNNNSK